MSKSAVDGASERNGDLNQMRPRAHVLKSVLPFRYRALLQSSRVEEAKRGHEAFLARCDAYREAINRQQTGIAASAERTSIGGLEWSVPADSGGESGFAHRMLHKGWLPLTDILLGRELAVGTVMLDIGANIGTTSIPRVILGDFQRAYVAEPEGTNYDCLVRNVVANGLAGFVLPDRVAMGASDGSATLMVSAKMTSHRVAPVVASSDAPDAPRHEVVNCRRLDTWVQEHAIDLVDVAFIKCDTQGSEVNILRGAAEVLRFKHIAWQLEFWPKGLRKAGSDRMEFYELVRASFTHFLDLSTGLQRRPHIRPTTELEADLATVGTDRGVTDLLVYNIAE